jgi:dipeptidyl aminopeptidase/acylaminoacyl peptidase
MLRSSLLALALSPVLVLAQTKPTLKAADYGKWERVGLQGPTLSPNGQWVAYAVERVNEENDLRLTRTANNGNSNGGSSNNGNSKNGTSKNGTSYNGTSNGGSANDGDTTVVVAYGTNPVFTTNSRWLGYTIGVSPAERDRLTTARRPVRNSVGVRNLAANSAETTKDVTSWSFSRDGNYIAMRRYPAEGKHGAEVVVQNLASGDKLSFGNVTEMSWAEGAPLLAMTLESDAGSGAANSVQLYDARSGVIKSLDASPSLYRQLAWRESSTDLAVLRSRGSDRGFRDTAYTLITWTGLASVAPVKKTLDSATTGVAANMRVAEYRRPEWAKDGSVVFVGLRPRVAGRDTGRVMLAGGANGVPNSVPDGVPGAVPNNVPRNAGGNGVRNDSGNVSRNAVSNDPLSDVQIWHPKDVRLQQEQKVEETQDLQRTLLAAWHPTENRVVQLGTALDEQITILEGSRYVTETDHDAYAWGVKFGRSYHDLYVTDVKTGARRKVLEKNRYLSGRSTTGRKQMTFDGKDWWSTDLVTGSRVNLTAKVDGKFTNAEYDTPTDMMPSYGGAGWVRGDASVIAYDKHDLWLLAADGSAGRRLTDGYRDGTVYRVINVSTDRTPGIDLTKPLYLAAYGDKTKRTGYAVLRGSQLDRVVFADTRYTNLRRADSADVFAFVRERFDDSPDVFAGADLRTATQRSKTNPDADKFAWGKTELINFKSARGLDLQGILYYPANYDASKKYPMIVYTYELLSQELHNYIVPSERSYYNRTAWTQQGYFVLTPDIVFRAREPGVSTLDAVEPAVRAVVARGLVDSTKVGHIGHSWGGYEAAFLPTRTRIFAASVAGAAITNMLSFMGELHWGPGIAELGHWETGQARMEVPYWEDFDAYVRNSPVAKINDLKSPVLLMTGDNDGTVYWHQAVEYYNYARRAGREDVVMLVYPTEDHGLRKKENQIDYHRRINEWFGHYLKGEPAPKWMTQGQSWLDRKAALDSASTRRP